MCVTIRVKYTANWGVQIAENIFQIRFSSILKRHFFVNLQNAGFSAKKESLYSIFRRTETLKNL